jgi:hypothetical protein
VVDVSEQAVTAGDAADRRAGRGSGRRAAGRARAGTGRAPHRAQRQRRARRVVAARAAFQRICASSLSERSASRARLTLVPARSAQRTGTSAIE